ncbi:MAG: GNAT family N-acetyltransferase [Saccharospirillaceae bacterium]|nr:GNAT family N-acetyltransferase [Pseudomonadales bacterium]NRB79027.1 GNAT family N-acetyltransferase [Saccharospirillaceae bacterium]
MDKIIKSLPCNIADAKELAEIRAKAMKPSLEKLGRFDEKRVRSRFLETFLPDDTFKIELNDELAGFYVVRNKEDYLFLDHLYIDPQFQNNKLGEFAINQVKEKAIEFKKFIKLGALKQSRSNDFYKKQGFVFTHDDEFDNYYVWNKSVK